MSKEHLARSSFHAEPHALFDESAPTRKGKGKSRPRKVSFTAERVAIIKAEPVSSLGLRVGALAALISALCLLGYIGNGVYHAFADSVVAPIILAPDSELVTNAKLSLNKLLSERDGVQRRLADNRELAQAAGKSTEQLRQLKSTADRALKWSDVLSERVMSSSTSDLNVLTQQRSVLGQALSSKRAHLDELRKNLAAGLVSNVEVVKEEVQLRELEHLALQNERERLQTSTKLAESRLTQQALHGGRALITPDMVEQQKALVHIDLELVRLEAEQRTRTQAIGSDEAELARLDRLLSELRAKPTFQAIEARQELAFVPYNQLRGVGTGAEVYECQLFGVFVCDQVGTILNVFPGEVLTPDPWGTPTRGRYAAMRLEQPSAATARSLRVRPIGGADDEIVAPELTEENSGSTALEAQRAER
jgi:hypothetical protein